MPNSSLTSMQHAAEPGAQSNADRRTFFKLVSPGTVVGIACLAGLPRSSTAAEEAGSSGGAKLVFVLFKKADLTREESLAEWMGERHSTIVRKVPGLRKWVQNHVISEPLEGMPVGIGELWFDDQETMRLAMNSPEMGAATEDAKNFLDMEKTYAVVVEEKTIIG